MGVPAKINSRAVHNNPNFILLKIKYSKNLYLQQVSIDCYFYFLVSRRWPKRKQICEKLKKQTTKHRVTGCGTHTIRSSTAQSSCASAKRGARFAATASGKGSAQLLSSFERTRRQSARLVSRCRRESPDRAILVVIP